ncbi:hypothetical protein DFH09DRAFT_1088947 [Mycena vulgaris]|nr:hypothetical protein DFH09DRAFT_1088947 [Mycena vulgaris]
MASFRSLKHLSIASAQAALEHWRRALARCKRERLQARERQRVEHDCRSGVRAAKIARLQRWGSAQMGDGIRGSAKVFGELRACENPAPTAFQDRPRRARREISGVGP